MVSATSWSNLGLPTRVAAHVPPGIEVWLHSENGLLGIGPPPTEDEIDADIINAGKQTVTRSQVRPSSLLLTHLQ